MMICLGRFVKDKEATYLVPPLGERSGVVYKTDKKLMSTLEEILRYVCKRLHLNKRERGDVLFLL